MSLHSDAAATPALVGPIPFTDIKDSSPPTPPEQHNELISKLPHKNHPCAPWGMRLYEGLWWPEPSLPGVLALRGGFAAADTDILVASPGPEYGTAWLKFLTFATMTRSYYHIGKQPLIRLSPDECVPILEDAFAAGRGGSIEALPPPRTLSTHIPYSMLPESVTAVTASGCKILYIWRDPKDALVSLWRSNDAGATPPLLADVCESFCEGDSAFGPAWEHALGYWKASQAAPERVMFFRYEEMLEEPGESLKRLSEFLGRPFLEKEEKAGLLKEAFMLCAARTLRKLEAPRAAGQRVNQFAKESLLLRAGVGEWRKQMAPEVAQRVDGILQEKFRGTGLEMQANAMN